MATKLVKIALFIVFFSPITALAATFTTPSGVVVNEFGQILYSPHSTVKVTPTFTGDPKKLCKFGGYQFGKPTGDACKIYLLTIK